MTHLQCVGDLDDRRRIVGEVAENDE